MQNVSLDTVRRLIGALVLVAIASTAEAGPPLICNPFQTGSAALLPWGSGPGWNTPDASYNVRRVVADTTRLLTPDAPILARMENLRRATIYAAQNRDTAFELVTAVLGRALTAQAAGSRDPLPFFDAAYVVEAFKQARGLHRWNPAREGDWYSNELGPLSGHPFIERALALSGDNAEIQFAASLMHQGAAAEAHRRKAIAAARPGSWLAKSLER
jgi:hypothetical protein